MKKLTLSLLVAMVAVTSAVSAIDMKAITNFYGNAPAGKFYVPFIGGTDLLIGASVVGYQAKDTELGYNVNLGVAADLPLLGTTDIFIQASKGSTVIAPATKVAPFVANTICVEKNWMSKITDKVSLGLTARLLTLRLEGENSAVSVMSYISPSLGATISLF